MTAPGPPMSVEELCRKFTTPELRKLYAGCLGKKERSDDRSDDRAGRVRLQRNLELALVAVGVDPKTVRASDPDVRPR